METAPADTTAVPTGQWDETDAQTVADEMIGDMLQGEWLQRWTEEHDEHPTVFIGLIKNKTMQHIDTDSLYYHLNQKLRKADRVQVNPDIARKIRKEVRSKRRTQRDMGKPWILHEEIMSKSQENGADFVIRGTITSNIPENQSGDMVNLFYTVHLVLINLDANRRAWRAGTEVKKRVPRSKLNM